MFCMKLDTNTKTPNDNHKCQSSSKEKEKWLIWQVAKEQKRKKCSNSRQLFLVPVKPTRNRLSPLRVIAHNLWMMIQCSSFADLLSHRKVFGWHESAFSVCCCLFLWLAWELLGWVTRLHISFRAVFPNVKCVSCDVVVVVDVSVIFLALIVKLLFAVLWFIPPTCSLSFPFHIASIPWHAFDSNSVCLITLSAWFTYFMSNGFYLDMYFLFSCTLPPLKYAKRLLCLFFIHYIHPVIHSTEMVLVDRHLRDSFSW